MLSSTCAKNLPTYGLWDGCFLTTDAHERLYVQPGCEHDFLVVSDMTDFHYKVTTPYNPRAECALRWDDPDLAIDWSLEIGIELTLFDKDKAAPSFKECERHDKSLLLFLSAPSLSFAKYIRALLSLLLKNCVFPKW